MTRVKATARQLFPGWIFLLKVDDKIAKTGVSHEYHRCINPSQIWTIELYTLFGLSTRKDNQSVDSGIRTVEVGTTQKDVRGLKCHPSTVKIHWFGTCGKTIHTAVALQLLFSLCFCFCFFSWSMLFLILPCQVTRRSEWYATSNTATCPKRSCLYDILGSQRSARKLV